MVKMGIDLVMTVLLLCQMAYMLIGETAHEWMGTAMFLLFIEYSGRFLNILALQYRDSGKLSTDVPNVDTGVDWLVYLAQHSQQCQAQSHFVVRSRLDIVENTEIMAGPNQAFYCGTLRPDYRPFRTGIFNSKLSFRKHKNIQLLPAEPLI